MRMRAWEGILAGRPYACALTTVSMTPAKLVLIFQSVFESRSLACSAHTVCDDARHRSGVVSKSAMPRKNRLHSKRCLRVVKPFLTQFSSLGSFFFLDEIPAWPFFGKPFFGTRQYCI